jgi:virginiamycin B lyase
VYAAENYANKIAKLQGGTVTEYSVPTADSQVQMMAIGSDGNAWFTEQGSNKIARMNPDNSITEFATGVSVGAPFDITPGPDGSLWSTVQHSTLLNITASGSITTAAVPAFGGDTYSPYMQGLVVDSNGTAWFGDDQNNSIVQRTSSGTLTKHAIPTANAMPTGLTVGPDGRIWFTEYTAPKVGAIDPSTGTMTEYSMPTGSYPFDIVSACGNLWISEKGTNNIGMMTTSGTLTEYAAGTYNNQPARLAVGPDGNVWFTAYTGNSIAKITTSGT